MKKIRISIAAYIAGFVLLSPALAFAHATPVSMSPESAATLESAPAEISIRFSEHIDAAASSLVVTGPSGAVVSRDRAQTSDGGFVLSTPVQSDGTGTYLVSWSVVSADDGHYTKGAYPYAVGKGTVIDARASDVQIVQISTTPEALASALELFGNGLIWAVLLLFIFAIRPVLASGRFEGDRRVLERGYTALLSAGVAFALIGGVLQILLKVSQLASLQSLALSEALARFCATAAGEALLARIAIAMAVLIIFFFGRRRIFASARPLMSEFAMIAAMLAFAFFRAKISHATANPFFPDFSIFVNVLHLVEKDIWAGIVCILALIAFSKRMRPLLEALLPRAFQMLAVDLGAVSVTAAYIVWLHLKSFENLFLTQWGTVFLQLLTAATCLVAMRVYHVIARLRAREFLARYLSISFAAEFACALLVVYYSSLVIITSPPLPAPGPQLFAADEGVRMELSADPYEDGQMLLSLMSPHPLKDPLATLQREAGGEALSIELTKRFDGGYVFPTALFSQTGVDTVRIIAPQDGGYDAHAEFRIEAASLQQSGESATRPLDAFTVSMIAVGIFALVFAAVLYRLSGARVAAAAATRGTASAVAGVVAFLAIMFALGDSIAYIGSAALANPFRGQCIADGNEWHLMQPMKAGVALSQTSREGCMWGMGQYMYMFADRREYEYYRDLGPIEIELSHEPRALMAGVPTTLGVSLKEKDGSPAALFVDMEKIMHMVIISKDETVFAHIHPDDARALTKKEIDSSTFTLTYTFPKAGEYLIAIDYAHGTTLGSKQFAVHVGGTPAQAAAAQEYKTRGTFGGYDVALEYPLPLAGEVVTLKYAITKAGKPAPLVPYLSAAMHIAAVKNDFSWFLHAHGEVHAPGAPFPPIVVRDGKVVHTMAMMATPSQFTSPIEAHLIFPSAGLYTVWGQFKTASGEIVPTAFTVRVE